MVQVARPRQGHDQVALPADLALFFVFQLPPGVRWDVLKTPRISCVRTDGMHDVVMPEGRVVPFLRRKRLAGERRPAKVVRSPGLTHALILPMRHEHVKRWSAALGPQ